MKSIVFQINKRYLARKRSPLRFVDNISENGECFIKNADAPTDKDYLILLFINSYLALMLSVVSALINISESR